MRVGGTVEVVAAEESDAYWRTRPRESQIAAVASRQSRVLRSRSDLLRRVAALRARYRSRDVPRPRDWVGYRIVPDEIELWTHREHRLHDRVRYRRVGPDWRCERLEP